MANSGIASSNDENGDCSVSRNPFNNKLQSRTCFYPTRPKIVGDEAFVVHEDFKNNSKYEFYAELISLELKATNSICSDIYFIEVSKFLSDREIPNIYYGSYPTRSQCFGGSTTFISSNQNQPTYLL